MTYWFRGYLTPFFRLTAVTTSPVQMWPQLAQREPGKKKKEFGQGALMGTRLLCPSCDLMFRFKSSN